MCCTHVLPTSSFVSVWTYFRSFALQSAGFVFVLAQTFSRMRSRKVPVLKLGSRGPGGDARSLRCVRKAFASVRKRPQASASEQSQGSRGGHGREAQNCLASGLGRGKERGERRKER